MSQFAPRNRREFLMQNALGLGGVEPDTPGFPEALPGPAECPPGGDPGLKGLDGGLVIVATA